MGLGFLPGENYSVANGVSADGSIVVGYSIDTNTFSVQAFRWTQSGGMVSLGDGLAYGVSADGSVVVGDSNLQAFRWTAGGGMVQLGLLPGGPPGGIASSGRGVSADGSVVVGFSSSASASEEAFRWTAGGGMVGLGALPGGTSKPSYGYAVSADGSVVVGISASSLGDEAFRWTSADGMVGLGFLPGDNVSFARSTSADGSTVVGDSTTVNSLVPPRAFRWTQSGGMVSLGPGLAYGVSGDGSVAVGQCGSLGVGGACIWDATNGMRHLQEVLTGYGLDLTGWSLGVATAVSADGETVVGYGTGPGGHQAWIATLFRSDVTIEVQPLVPKDPVFLNSPLPLLVAVLGSSTVDVTQIDTTTLGFGPKRAAPVFTQIITVGSQKDLLAFFEVQDSGIALGDTQACLRGKIGGQPFRGCDDIVVIMAKNCGVGFELAPILPAVLWLRGRRRRKASVNQ